MIIIKEAEEFAKLQRTSATIEQIKNSYEKDAEQILKEVGVFKNVLDIGCGIAGWECLFKDIEIYLIDKSTTDKDLHYGFQKTGSFYNSLDIARQNLIANGVKEENIFTQECTNANEILFNEEFDLIVSLISCGFHYPVETYLNQIHEKLKADGSLIIDIRKGTNGKDAIEKLFGNLRVIEDQKKYERVIAVKKQKP